MISLAQIQTGLKLTQADMAKLLKISIPTYRRLLENCGDLRMDQANMLVNMYNEKQTDERAKITLNDIQL